MKEVKAFIHRNRAADVIRALKGAGFGNLSVVDVKGMLAALDERERDHSMELGEETITEVKLELVCVDESRATGRCTSFWTMPGRGNPKQAGSTSSRFCRRCLLRTTERPVVRRDDGGADMRSIHWPYATGSLLFLAGCVPVSLTRDRQIAVESVLWWPSLASVSLSWDRNLTTVNNNHYN